LKSDRETLFTQHTHTKRKLGQNIFPQKTANMWKLGTAAKETKSVSMLNGKIGGGGQRLRDMKQLYENKIQFTQK